VVSSGVHHAPVGAPASSTARQAGVVPLLAADQPRSCIADVVQQMHRCGIVSTPAASAALCDPHAVAGAQCEIQPASVDAPCAAGGGGDDASLASSSMHGATSSGAQLLSSSARRHASARGWEQQRAQTQGLGDCGYGRQPQGHSFAHSDGDHSSDDDMALCLGYHMMLD
jgi:hypothetical protein